jgi:hypothetical protein
MSIRDQYSLIEATHKKWLENENDLDDDKYELPILKYDANQEALVEQKEGAPMEEIERTLVEEEGEPITPSQLASKEGEDIESMDKECYESNNHVIVEL